MAGKLSVSSAWDEKLGVWVGERAAATDMSELPDPLYILGYGSLIWRPGALLENCKTYKCTALGSMRLFAQRSCDHRGTPEFPGLVLNLVQDDVLEELGYRTKDMHRSEFRGLVWHVPKEAVTAVIEDLDYRERGGYHRHIIPVRLDADLDGKHKEVNALVYTGAPSNPNFYLPLSSALETDVATVIEPPSQATVKKEQLDAFNLCKRNVMTDTIAAAVGPSGPNVDYLCNLEAFLSSNDMHDPFLTDLATSVRLRLGIWRGRLYRGKDHASSQSLTSMSPVGVVQKVLPYSLLGWGSNEFLQLSNTAVTTNTSGGVDQRLNGNGLLAHRYFPALLSNTLPSLVTASDSTLDTVSHGEETHSDATSAHSTSTSSIPNASKDPLHFAGLESRYVVAGGGTSAVLEHGNVRIFGSLLPQILTHARDDGFPAHADNKTDGGSDDVAVQNALRNYNHSIVIEGIAGVAIGHDHLLLLHRRPVASSVPHKDTSSTEPTSTVVQYEDVVVAIGNDSHGQCAGSSAAAALGVSYIESSDLILRPNPATNGSTFLITTLPGERSVRSSRHATLFNSQPAPSILKLVAGLRHSAAITADGRLVTWGDNRHGQCIATESKDNDNDTNSSIVWSTPNGAKLVDVACGAKFTIVLDDLGIVYALGSPPGVSIPRSQGPQVKERVTGVPVEVIGLPKDVRWQRVTCGWSHVVLRGLSASMDRKLDFYAWGKQNLAQFPSAEPVETLSEGNSMRAGENSAELTVSTVLTPRPLAPLPQGHSIAEVWCGSEFTLAADEAGGLWACGWNEHGNCGVGSPSSHLVSQSEYVKPAEVVSQWTRVKGCAEDANWNSERGLQLSHVWEGAVACGGGHILHPISN
eukprot:gene11865-13763_t